MIKHIEVHWWIKDSVQRKRITGIDIVTDEHLKNELKHIITADCLDDFCKDDANFCLSEFADSGCDVHSDGENWNGAFVVFSGAINTTVIEPIDFGINKIKKIKHRA